MGNPLLTILFGFDGVKLGKMKKREIIELTEENQKDVENALLKINEILKMEKPPEPIKKKYCKKCAYFELCFS